MDTSISFLYETPNSENANNNRSETKHEEEIRNKPPVETFTNSDEPLNIEEFADFQTAYNKNLHDDVLRQTLEDEYDRALQDSRVEMLAIQASVRQSLAVTVAFMLLYLTTGCLFFSVRLGWSIRDSLMFAIYTVTTVGYGYHDIPNSSSVQFFVIGYTFVGIAAVTTMLSEAYQFLVLETRTAQIRNSEQFQSLKVKKRDSNLNRRKSKHLQSDNKRENNNLSTTDEYEGDDGCTSKVLVFKNKLFENIFDKIDLSRDYLNKTKTGRIIKFLLPFLGLWIFGAVVVGTIEEWSLAESLYWAAVTLTTVGFGDYYPTKNASIWFSIFYLPTSLGFMSFFLANVARFYIKVHNRNIVRIERQIRAQISRECARNSSNFPLGGGVEAVEMTSNNKNFNSRFRQDYFAALPSGDSNNDTSRAPQSYLRGRSFSDGVRYREQVMVQARSGRQASAPSGNNKKDNDHAMIQTPKMKNVIEAAANIREEVNDSITTMSGNIKEMNSVETAAKGNIKGAVDEENIISSSSTVIDRKPSFHIRIRVQERLAKIISYEIAGFHSRKEIKDDTLIVKIEAFSDIAQKWFIPRRARTTMRTVSFNVIYFVGERNLISKGPEALFDLTPMEFHSLFAPFLASMGDEETMITWLNETNLLAEVELTESEFNNTGSSGLVIV